MKLDLGDALEEFMRAEFMELNCGKFDIVIAPAALHNEEFKAETTRRVMSRKKKSLAVENDSLTGSYEDDVEVYIKTIIKGWGKRPLMSDGKELPCSPEVLRELFTGTGNPGRVLFSKIVLAATSDSSFRISEEDLGKSSPSSG